MGHALHDAATTKSFLYPLFGEIEFIGSWRSDEDDIDGQPRQRILL
jgi:hypothetical protein